MLILGVQKWVPGISVTRTNDRIGLGGYESTAHQFDRCLVGSYGTSGEGAPTGTSVAQAGCLGAPLSPVSRNRRDYRGL